MDKSTLLLHLFLFMFSALMISAAPSLPPEAVPTKSGYLPVDESTRSSMFYAFYEAETPTQALSETPLIISSINLNFAPAPQKIIIIIKLENPQSLLRLPWAYHKKFECSPKLKTKKKKIKMDESTLLRHLFLFMFSALMISAAPSLPPKAVPTKSGYLPVDPSSSSSMFYAFYEAETPTQALSETPLIIWLQGGPGCSSMLGNFLELGPFLVKPHPHSNPASWNRLFGLLFLDNPIGTGFSFAAKPQDIPTDQRHVSQHLFTAITAFLNSNSAFVSRPLFITGESYAGKYVPSIAYHILNSNESVINLAGVAIGNGLTDPILQVGTHAKSAYFSGLINMRQMRELERAQEEAVRLTKAGNWSHASDARSRVLSTLQEMTGLATLYDFRRRKPYEDDMVEEFVGREDVKRALRAKDGIVFQVCSDSVGAAMHEDVMKSTKYMVEYLVKRIRVLLYQGLFDLRDGVVSTERWVRTMDWEGIGAFLEAERKVWRVGGELAGYVQRSGRLTNAVVWGAGHLVPADQGLNSQAMIEDWVLGRGLF